MGIFLLHHRRTQRLLVQDSHMIALVEGIHEVFPVAIDLGRDLHVKGKLIKRCAIQHDVQTCEKFTQADLRRVSKIQQDEAIPEIEEIGRASRREGVWRSVWTLVDAVSLKTKK